MSVPVTGRNGDLTVVMSVDEADLLHGLRLAPGPAERWTPPPYVRPGRFQEHEVVVGSGRWPCRGR